MVKTKKKSSTYFFYKSILRKVSFDATLFRKELDKALIVLSEKEGIMLYRWALTFTKSNPDLSYNLQYTL
ncbi:MAG: hypothetical protein CMB98_06325 [Flavobacteriaceae bacterium]|nr:hypothetical protein [Flavobacteriaceae bacterium]